MNINASSMLAHPRTCRSRLPFGPRYCAAPPSPENRSRVKGWFIRPNTGSPKRIRPISVPQASIPEMNDLVPSIGSSTQTYSASVCSEPYSSPRIPWSGNCLRMIARMRLFGRAVGCRNGVESADFLVLDRKGGAKERENGFAGRGGELIDEAAEVDGRHAARLFKPTAYRRASLSATARANAPVGVFGSRFSAVLLRCGVPTGPFSHGPCRKETCGMQPCKNSIGNGPSNLDFCASRCSLLQCGSESYCCPPWAFPP